MSTAAPSDATTAYRQSADAVVASLDTDAHRGLTQSEARQRLDLYGKNELESDEPIPGWKRFLAQFRDVLVLLLLVATAISVGVWLHERPSALPYEAMAIFAVVLLNATMGYIQEARADRAVAALRKMSAAQVRVIRDGERRSIPATELVPGDVIVVHDGNVVPADARVIEAMALRVAEAVLTGESLPVSKDPGAIQEEVGVGDRRNMLFSGTAATYGHGKAVVVATGMQTQIGHIARRLRESTDRDTPLQKELARIGKLLGLIVVVIAAVVVATILIVERVRGLAGLVDLLVLGVALAVAAVPEGLPAVVTAALSIGVQRMARRNAIVRRLASVETLGSADVIASDKTGTLTRNEMTVRVVATASGRMHFGGTGYAPHGEVSREGGGRIDGALWVELQRALAVADRANDATVQEREGRFVVQGDPTEGALVVAARKAGLEGEVLEARFNRIGEVPFSSERKLMSTVHTDAERQECLLVFTKGAPDVLLARCSHELVGEERRPLSDGRRADILKINEELAHDALRVIAVAFRSLPADAFEDEGVDERIEHDLVLAGLIGMMDPPREEAWEAVARAKAAGIRPIIITGDHPATAAVIAVELGISADERVLSGTEIEKLSDDDLTRRLSDVSVCARVSPEHKLRIVRALQQSGAIVAVTGDGVNDAPALKTADIGIAMGVTGSDVAKEAADLVLADDNFASIVAAVEEGRGIFSNIQKFLRYLLASNVGEVLTMFFGILSAGFIGLTAAGRDGLVLPLVATQILWINLVTDGAPALALAVDPADAGVMTQPPRTRGERVITGRMWFGIVLTGLITSIGTLLVLDASLPGGLVEGSGDLRYAQTMAFTTLVFFSLFTVLNARSDERSAFSGLFSNTWLWAAIALSLVLQAAVVYVPFLQTAFGTTRLGVSDWLFCAAVASSVLWLRELHKAYVRQRDRAATMQPPRVDLHGASFRRT